MAASSRGGAATASPACCDSGGAAGPGQWGRDSRRARLLAWGSLGWMTAEGGIGLAAGVAAGSVALLAPWITYQAVSDLASRHQEEASAAGIALTAASVVIMPVLGAVKRRLGRRLDSGATVGEGTQNLMCAAQAAAVLAVVAAWPGAWPADPVIALGIAAWSAWEGRQSWRGANCCKAPPSPALKRGERHP